MPADAPQPGPGAAPAAPVALPDAVRRRVLDVAAQALGALPESDLPASLVQVRRFAPGRRASAGAIPLASALERDEGFRAAVGAVVRDAEPDLAAVLVKGEVPPAADPVEVAALAYLLRDEGWQELLERAAGALRERAVRSAARETGAELERLRAALDDAARRLEAVRGEADEAVRAAAEELAGLRRELRRHRSDADRARAEARAAAQAAEQAGMQARQAVAAAEQRARRAEAALARAQEELATLRRADREGRSLAGSRARLLLDTVVDAAAGLRRELGLPPADVLPGDLVGDGDTGATRATATRPRSGVAARAREDDDPAVLAELLTMPRVHLVVDGYNVTKGAYGDLPLADQRARLLSGLSSLQARTRAEITCCFDGAVVEGRVSGPAPRGVRVRFSEPGEIADDLIRRLVRAEPEGRVVVVVSSDREVADGVRAAGARPVPSAALARLLERS